MGGGSHFARVRALPRQALPGLRHFGGGAGPGAAGREPAGAGVGMLRDSSLGGGRPLPRHAASHFAQASFELGLLMQRDEVAVNVTVRTRCYSERLGPLELLC